ncbi:hypothetical protein [Pseudoalteromonas ulvae]|uniref:Uncharacterized protein n=1 Tax=Pseudoalteromonas ulvae TaxID=107327 RepID=A0A244CQW2_PSEDV|nr:hypothetical protein [Pseudoalteromonas ulvae]OUL57876.1 hypothetical protein B1199_12545 [Pseudoalteromonas ulvae]
MNTKIVLSTLLFSGLTCINVGATTLDEIDFASAIETQDLLYAPIKGTTSNRGAFWYKDIQQKVVGPSSAGWGIKRITVRAFPQSHNNNVYTDFVSANSILDIRQNILPTDAILCEATDALVNKLKDYGIYYNLQSNTGNYPSVCSLQLKYQTSNEQQEAEIVDFINQNKVINVSYNILSSATPAVYMDAPAIVSALVDDSILVLDVPKERYTGDAYKVLFQSAQYASSLFRSDKTNGEQLEYTDWKRFIDLHEFSTSATLLLDKSKVEQQVELTVPGSQEQILSVNF